MSILTEIQKTAANADEKIKHLYETAFPEGEKIPWDSSENNRGSPLDNERNEGWASAHLPLFRCSSTKFEKNNSFYDNRLELSKLMTNFALWSVSD